MKLPKKITWVSGMPRSGTTWLSQIFASSPDVRLKFCPLFSYEFKNVLNEQSSKNDWAKLFYDVYRRKSDFLDQEHLRRHGLVPKFTEKSQPPEQLVIKSTRFHHLLPNILSLHPEIKFIHIIRHPCASIYSWLSNPSEFPDDANPDNEWKTGECRKKEQGEFWGFSDWKWTTTQAIQLEKNYPDRFKIIQYENLVNYPEDCVKSIFEFCSLDLKKQTKNFLKMSHSKHDANKRSVFKKPTKNQKWEENLDINIVNEIIEDIKGTELEIFMETINGGIEDE